MRSASVTRPSGPTIPALLLLSRAVMTERRILSNRSGSTRPTLPVSILRSTVVTWRNGVNLPWRIISMCPLASSTIVGLSVRSASKPSFESSMRVNLPEFRAVFANSVK